MENNEQEEGLTLGELFRVVFNKKWILLIATAIVTIIGLLFIGLSYNKSKTNYVTDFTLVYPGIEEGRYPDGTTFNYRDLISLDSLEKTKESNPLFDKIDVETMYEENDINISQLTSSDDSLLLGQYSISVKQKYFSSNTVAKDFITALTNQPATYALTVIKKMNYKTNLSNYSSAIAYETQIDYLIAQRDLILSGYESMISRYSSSFMLDDKSLGEYLSEVQVYFDNNKINTLYTELQTNGYVKDIASYLETIELEIKALEIEQEDNNKMLVALKKELADLVGIFGNSNTQTYETFNERIVELTIRNIEIERELLILNGYKEDSGSINKNSVSFEKKLDKYYKDLNTFTDKYVTAISKVYETNSKVTFHNNSIIIATGGISLTFAGVASLFIGFILSFFGILIMELPKYLKDKKQKNIIDQTN